MFSFTKCAVESPYLQFAAYKVIKGLVKTGSEIESQE